MKVADILAGGTRLIRTQPKAVAIWGVLYLVLTGVTFALISPMFGQLLTFQQQALAAQAAQLPPPAPPAGFFGAIFGLDAILLVAMLIIFAAAVRAVAADGRDDAFAFLRLGMDEARLLGLGILLFLIGLAATIVFVIAAVVIVAALAALLGRGAIAAGVLLYIAGIAAVIWAEVRISLAGALTVLRGRIVIREAWRTTRGRFWTLFGAYLLIALVFAVFGIVAVMVTNPGLLSAYAGGMRPGDMQATLAAQNAMMVHLFSPGMILWFLIAGVFNAIGIAFTYGAVATAAIGLDGELHGLSAAGVIPPDPGV